MYSKVVLTVVLALSLILLYFEDVNTAQSAEKLIGKTERMSPLVWFCDSPNDLDVMLNQKPGRPDPDSFPGCRRFEDGALITIHAIEIRKTVGAEAILLRVAVAGYGTQYVIYDWRHVIANEI